MNNLCWESEVFDSKHALPDHFRKCKNIHFITEEIDNLYNTTQLTYVKQKVEDTTTLMTEIKTNKENQIKELGESFDKEVETVKTYKQELQTLLDNAEHETIGQLKSGYDRVKSDLASDINKVQNQLDKIEDLNQQFKMSKENKAQEFVSMKLLETAVNRAEMVGKLQQTKPEETISFSADQNIKSSLQTNRALGKVSSKNLRTMGQKDTLYTLKCQKEIDVKLASDYYDCNIYGSWITDDGTLLLADFKNKKLKRLNESNERVIDFIDLPAAPRDVCEVNKQAVVSMDNKTIQFVDLGNTLTATRTFKMDHNCYGLARIEGKLFISDYGNGVFIYDINGHEMKRIVAGNSRRFRKSAHIAVSSGGHKLVVADYEWHSKTIVTLDIQGKYLSTMDYKLTGPHGICTDGTNVFAGGFESGNIIQIGKDDKYLGELAKIKRPLSLSFDHQKNRLIVTAQDQNKIVLLELE